MYNRDDHRQDDNEEGVKGKPYAEKAKGKGMDVDALDLCPECKDKVSAALAEGKKKKAAKKTRKAAKKGGRKSRGRKGKGGKTAKKSHKKRHEKRH